MSKFVGSDAYHQEQLAADVGVYSEIRIKWTSKVKLSFNIWADQIRSSYSAALM